MRKIIHFFIVINLFLLLQLSVFASDNETLIIFDASVSMREKFYGTPKYLIAINEVKNVLNNISPSRSIGLRTIGITIDSSLFTLIQNPSKMCEATQLVVPIGKNNNLYIKNSLDAVIPLGTTPLTYTLDTAINYDFNKTSQLKHIILITDGAESCNGDPCKYIKGLTKIRSDIKIDIVAIDVNIEDYKQLKCLSDLTYGTIKNITKPVEFSETFDLLLSPDFSSNQIKTNLYKTKNKDEISYKNFLIETYK